MTVQSLVKVILASGLILLFSGCEKDEVTEVIALSINGEEAIQMPRKYCSFDDGHLYISGNGTINGEYTQVSFSIFNMTKGETGTFACEDYTSSTDCAWLTYEAGSFTSGEYTGDSGFTASELVLTKSGKIMEGAFSGVLEGTSNSSESVTIGVGFYVLADD